MMFAGHPSGLTDIDAMRVHLRTDRTVAASAERTFEVLATGEGQREWAQGYRATTWHSPPPFGPGAIRDIHLRWITVRERFLAWEPGRRFAFSSDAMSIGLAHRMIEDIAFEPLDAGHCALTWQVHLDPVPALRPIERLFTDRVLAPMFDSFAAGLAAYATAHPHR
ncbi:SRPBCC family protein [Nocardia sp. NBC_00511]|uniref:SRPBCC family protein n=1 Tax=Nocardia sp. NBC_00511 TaxID=2903591 RepID=UPI0030E01115